MIATVSNAIFIFFIKLFLSVKKNVACDDTGLDRQQAFTSPVRNCSPLHKKLRASCVRNYFLCITPVTAAFAEYSNTMA
jgi:hypothetical protein